MFSLWSLGIKRLPDEVLLKDLFCHFQRIEILCPHAVKSCNRFLDASVAPRSLGFTSVVC